jgi:hypothetical protein
MHQRDSSRVLPTRPHEVRHRFIVPLAGLDRAALASLAYARSISGHVIAMHVIVDDEQAKPAPGTSQATSGTRRRTQKKQEGTGEAPIGSASPESVQ